jgi:acrylyl-CoA reductase (NADPH)
MTTFRALRIFKTEDGQRADFVTLTEDDLTAGDVTVAVSHSSVNFKDGLALTNRAPIIRHYPLNPGVDFAGTVMTSTHPDWQPGDQVVLNGWGHGEQYDGGFSEVARVRGDWLVAVPPGWTPADCMAVGVAGYTAMLNVMAMEEQGIKPGDGEVLVTGAAGGVGSVTVALLARLGHRVTAVTGRVEEAEFLKGLGAGTVIGREEFSGPVKALAKARWAAAIDSVGSTTLAHVISQTVPDGTVVACGNAQGMDLPTSVAPFILRGVKLIGVNSVTTPMPRRRAAWARIARDMDRATLASLATHVTLQDVPRIAADIVQGKVRGRVVVDL